MSLAITGEMNYLRAENLITFGKSAKRKEEWQGYRAAALRGHAAAQYKYGYMLSRGLIKKANFKSGMKYIKKSAMQGYPEAVCELARGYYYGFGVKRNLRRAAKVWNFGAKIGIPEAAYYLGLAYYKGEGVKKDEKKAEMFFEKAKNGGFLPSRV